LWKPNLVAKKKKHEVSMPVNEKTTGREKAGKSPSRMSGLTRSEQVPSSSVRVRLGSASSFE
jgi:hypothetical protein